MDFFDFLWDVGGLPWFLSAVLGACCRQHVGRARSIFDWNLAGKPAGEVKRMCS
jgi:hypothetical protein